MRGRGRRLVRGGRRRPAQQRRLGVRPMLPPEVRRGMRRVRRWRLVRRQRGRQRREEHLGRVPCRLRLPHRRLGLAVHGRAQSGEHPLREAGAQELRGAAHGVADGLQQEALRFDGVGVKGELLLLHKSHLHELLAEGNVRRVARQQPAEALEALSVWELRDLQQLRGEGLPRGPLHHPLDHLLATLGRRRGRQRGGGVPEPSPPWLVDLVQGLLQLEDRQGRRGAVGLRSLRPRASGGAPDGDLEVAELALGPELLRRGQEADATLLKRPASRLLPDRRRAHQRGPIHESGVRGGAEIADGASGVDVCRAVLEVQQLHEPLHEAPEELRQRLARRHVLGLGAPLHLPPHAAPLLGPRALVGRGLLEALVGEGVRRPRAVADRRRECLPKAQRCFGVRERRLMVAIVTVVAALARLSPRGDGDTHHRACCFPNAPPIQARVAQRGARPEPRREGGHEGQQAGDLLRRGVREEAVQHRAEHLFERAIATGAMPTRELQGDLRRLAGLGADQRHEPLLLPEQRLKRRGLVAPWQ
mmetsp:Transcript_21917/g.62168  ORF Transcript_21917/g.62168 Transcript_21917/m.62168 type:complete len:532 (+) Transcript_21917:858-2453(+)